MSCHGTPGNTAATSLACALTRTSSDEVSRRFHDLKREGSNETNPTAEDVLNWLDRQALAVRNDEHLSAWRAERMLGRIEEAKDHVLSGVTPDGSTWYAWKNLRAACDDAHTHAWLAASSGLDLPLGEATPQNIDEKLANLWEKINKESQRKKTLLRDLTHARGNLGRYGITEGTIVQREAAIAASEATLDELIDQTAPYESEYLRRNGWARYFRVVTSGEGHVHASMSCHSCYPTTIYVWLPSLSGHGEDEAVDEYGSEMCSHCFPGVLSHPRYQSRGRIAEQVAAARAEERAARTALKAAKAISNPDGSSLKLGRGRYPETIGSEVTAQRTLVDKLVTLRTDLSEDGRERQVREYSRLLRPRSVDDYAASLSQRAQETEEDITILLAALAHKRGLTPEQVQADLEAKVSAKARKVERERAAWESQNSPQ